MLASFSFQTTGPAGLPVSDSRVYVTTVLPVFGQSASSLTLKSLYSDAAGANALTQPLIPDALGNISAYCEYGTIYVALVITSNGGSTVTTVYPNANTKTVNSYRMIGLWTLTGVTPSAFEVFNDSSQYVPGTSVSYEGSVYVNIQACIGVLPSNSAYWTLTSPASPLYLDSVLDGPVTWGKTRSSGLNGGYVGIVSQDGTHLYNAKGVADSQQLSIDTEISDSGTTYARTLASALTSGAIDFGKTGFANKDMDHLSDGVVYARPVAAALTSGAIDFSKSSGFVNKDIDHLSDGVTYARVRGVALTNGVPTPFQGAWSNSVNYYAGQETTYQGTYWVCLVANLNSPPVSGNNNWQAVGVTGSEFQGAYNAGAAYVVGNQVTYGSPASYYVCIVGCTGQEPDISPTYWQQIGSSNTNNFEGAYNAGTGYIPGEQVTYNGSYWICISNSTGNAPSVTSGYWTLVGTSAIMLGAWVSGTAYVQGMQVVESGNVYTCTVANSDVTFTVAHWQLVGPQSLSNVADDATYSKTKTSGLTSGYATSTFDGATTYTIKGVGDSSTLSLDSEIVDGSTYARVVKADQTSGHVVKTGSAGAYTIKGVGDSSTLSLDSEIVNGTNYVKVPSTTYLTDTNTIQTACWSASNCSLDTTTQYGGATSSTSYVTVGSFVVTFPDGVNSLSAVLNLTNSVAQPTTYGPNTVSSGSGSGWTNPSYVTSVNSQFATYLEASADTTLPVLIGLNPALPTIPSGCTILGVVVTFYAYANISGGAGASAVSAQLRYNGSTLGTSKSIETDLPYDSSEQFSAGSSSYMWGLNTSTLTPAIINSSTFGFEVTFETLSVTNVTVSADGFQVTVYTSVGTFTGKSRLAIGTNYGTEVDLSGSSGSGTSVITDPTSGVQTVLVQAVVSSTSGGSIESQAQVVTSVPLSSSMLT